VPAGSWNSETMTLKQGIWVVKGVVRRAVSTIVISAHTKKNSFLLTVAGPVSELDCCAGVGGDHAYWVPWDIWDRGASIAWFKFSDVGLDGWERILSDWF
jgi:hypothetical protein